MRLKNQIHVRRLSSTAIVGAVIGSTLAAGLLGVVAGSVTASAPASPSQAVAVGSSSNTFTGSGLVNSSIATIPVPTGFTATTRSDGTVVLTNDDGRQRVVVSQISEPNAIDIGVLTLNLVDAERSSLDSNAKICADDGTDSSDFSVSDGSLKGAYLPLCLSVTPQNAPAFAAREYFYSALAQTGGHPVALVVQIFGSIDRFPGEVAALGGFVPSIKWNATRPASS